MAPKTYKRPSRTLGDDDLNDAVDKMWPESWPPPSPYMRQWIVQFTRGAIVAAEDRILNRVDVPRWAKHDRETRN